ncbi:MAG: carotenoid 1,2-hydratase [Deltaproteobacteria bacterium]|nr:carotenoid 1,2-hydratase [Deltaproteobacteria bacterium]
MTQQTLTYKTGTTILTLFFLLLSVGYVSSPVLAWQQAVKPRPFNFPRDHGQHENFQTEWWYITGNLATDNGRTFGFQFTIFRRGIREHKNTENPWEVRDLYLLHTSLSDFSHQQFYHYQDASRTGPGLAGASNKTLNSWIKGIFIRQEENKTLTLHCQTNNYTLDLSLTPGYPRPILHGNRGLSHKGAETGQASYYYSLPRLLTRGSITLAGKHYQVSGLSWYDHEFATNQLGKNQQGWDWISLHLDDDSSLMIYQMRQKNGDISPSSSGTFVFPDGSSEHLRRSDFSLTPEKRRWKSPNTGISYPLWWRLKLKKPRSLELILRPKMVIQEMKTAGTTRTIYWEGGVLAAGDRKNSKAIKGEGYLELTGYGKALGLRQQ